MDTPHPKVTVLMPVYNGERYLRQSIESILNQTFKDFEFLIVDDASQDSSRDIIRSYADGRIRLIENADNLGLVKTLNRGLLLAEAEYIARQDQDDISHPTRLEKQAAFLNDHPEIVLLGTRVNNIDGNGRSCKSYGYYIVTSELAIRWQVMFDNPFVHSTVMMRSQIVRQMGGYDDHFGYCEDYDLFSRLAQSYKATNLKEILCDYRFHPDSMTPHATKENNLLMGAIMQRTIKNYIRVDPPEEWIDFWLSVNNPNNFNSTVNTKKLIRTIESFHRKFISIYPDAKRDADIKEYISRMLIRISYNTTFKDRWGSFYCFCRVFMRDIPLAFNFLPKYLIAFFLGRHRNFVSKRFRTYCNLMGIKS